MTHSELEELLSLALAALRVKSAPAAECAPAMLAAEYAPSPAAHSTLAEWLDEHERQLGERDYMAQTLKNRSANIRHVRRLWGARPIALLKPHEVATGLRQFGPRRSSTARRVLGELRDAYAEAIANGWCETNPSAHIKAPKHKIIRARLRFETWQAMRTLAQAGRQRWVESLLLLALITGQRRADLAKMRFDDIVTDELGQQYLRIEQQKQAGKGYGARVEIPLALRLNAIGMTAGDVIEHCRYSAKAGDTLLRKAGGGAIEMSSLSARFHETIVTVLGPAAHGQHEWPSLHEARSLCARLYRAQGTDVQTLLGHKRPEMTAIYEDDRGLSAKEWKRVAVPA